MIKDKDFFLLAQQEYDKHLNDQQDDYTLHKKLAKFDWTYYMSFDPEQKTFFTKEKNEIIEKFDKQRKLSPSISLPEFFCIENNNFLARLLACPICLGVWINIIPSLTMSVPLSYYFPSLMLSFFLYYGLNKLING